MANAGRLYAEKSLHPSNLSTALPDYRDSLVRMMSVMAFTENAVAVGLKEFADKTSGSQKEHVLDAISDETKHGRLVYALLAEIGVNAQSADSLALSSTRHESLRASLDWMKPRKGWEDFVVYSFLLDRAGNYHLGNYLKSSYEPWAEVCAGIVKEEEAHGEFGIQELKKLAVSNRPLAEKTLAGWYPKILDFFGRPHSQTTGKYIYYGLKERDNEELRVQFRADTSKLLEELGLSEPKMQRTEYPYCPKT